MKSPFPGMDPYLEAHWGDVHTSLITYARDALQAKMPKALKVRVEEHVTVEVLNGHDHGYYPDIRVVEKPDWSRREDATGGTATAVVLEEPLVVPLALEPETQRFLQIIDTKSGHRVLTTIEILSPANKDSETGRETYLRKQRELIEGGVNLVEIDLLRDGGHVMAVARGVLPERFTGPYRICVTRPPKARHEVYRVSLHEPLPAVRIPLRETDPDVLLDLQAILEQAYTNGGYDDTDYRNEPVPPFARSDAKWADKLLREAGRR